MTVNTTAIDPVALGWRAVAAEMLSGTRAAASRFPITVLVLLALAVEANLAIAEYGDYRHDELIVALLGGAVASLAATLFLEARGVGSIRHASAAGFAALAFALLFWNDVTLTGQPPLVAALCGLVLLAPYLGRGTGAAFWQFSLRVAMAAILAGLALFLFAGGISAIFASLTYLFGVEVPERAYGHVWAATGLFAAPLFGLGQMPRDFTAVPDDRAAEAMDRGMRALGDFVAAPLLIVYAVILHVYAAKIVLTGDVPEGQIGWLVLAFGFCVFGSLIVIHPFLDAARAPTRLVLRLWPLFFPVPLLLLFYALVLRIGEYGVTPQRYFLALFGLGTAAIVLLQLPRRTRGDIRWMAALPVVALLVASFGPQGAKSVSIGSQASRFLELVAEKPVTGERHDEALAALRYLAAENALDRVASPDMAPESGDDEGSDFRRTAIAWGLDPDRPQLEGGHFSVGFNQIAAVQTGEFDLVVPMLHLDEGADPVAYSLPDGETVTIALAEGAIAIGSDGETISFTFTDADVARLAGQEGGAPPPALTLTAGERRLMLVPTHAGGMAASPARVTIISGTLLLRAGDWR